MLRKQIGLANKRQIGGDHYKKQTIQHWDWVVSNNLGYLEGCATKYISRHKEKGGKEDLLKAIHYIEKAIECYYPEKSMPIKVFGHTYKTFAGAEKAAAKKGIKKPAAYVATVERKQKGKKR